MRKFLIEFDQENIGSRKFCLILANYPFAKDQFEWLSHRFTQSGIRTLHNLALRPEDKPKDAKRKIEGEKNKSTANQ